MTSGADPVFRHDALFYAGEVDLLRWAVPFIRDGIAAGEPVLVVVPRGKVGKLRGALDGQATGVRFVDMVEAGRNPNLFLAAWQGFAAQHPDGRLRGIGEPVYAGRSPDEIAECHRHEQALNRAFARDPRLWLVCPYDVGALDHAVIEQARRTHPFVIEGGARLPNHAHIADGMPDLPLPEPPASALEITFQGADLAPAREMLHAAAVALGAGARADDLVFAANELMTNSVRHGRGSGRLLLWREDGALVCEVRDAGIIEDPLVGRLRPSTSQEGGFGLWLVNHICELVQVRSSAAGSIVRARLSLRAPASRTSRGT